MTDQAPHGADPDLLAAYVDGRLDAAGRERAAAHLADCRECRAVLAELGRGLAPVSRAGRLGRLVRSRGLPVAAVLVLSAATGVLLVRQQAGSPLLEGRPSGPSTAGAPPASDPATPTPLQPPSPRGPGARGENGSAPGTDESLLVKRGGARSVGGKSFRLVAGEWVDSAYDPLAALPVVVAAGPVEREALLAGVPALAAYAALGERVLVVHDGTVYRLVPSAR
jgi:hypothetical protein